MYPSRYGWLPQVPEIAVVRWWPWQLLFGGGVRQTVTRKDDRVRIDVTEAAGFAETDTEAIAQALEEYLSDDEVKVIHFDGPVLMERGPPDRLGSALRHLGDLARSRGKRFHVGPI